MLALTPVLGLENTSGFLRDLQICCSSSVCFILLCLCDVKQIVPPLHLPPPSASLLECRCLRKYHEWLTTVVKVLMKSLHFFLYTRCAPPPHQWEWVPWEMTDRLDLSPWFIHSPPFTQFSFFIIPSLLHQARSLPSHCCLLCDTQPCTMQTALVNVIVETWSLWYPYFFYLKRWQLQLPRLTLSTWSVWVCCVVVA